MLSIKQYEELNECIMLSRSNAELDEYTKAEWIKAYMYIISPAGVDTFCESNISEDELENINESRMIDHICPDLVDHILDILKKTKEKKEEDAI